ncbi:ATP-binding cassette sub-family G member 2 [Auxenochlorella protothecoides]|uniref:ATP-binding cassette sub-family G member 2 n=4 Tax=Auxenochlorella protothecoides TaxID=3075 RepID=A0A087ST64_AUXPR|nr:ATP-binding cassette sub-family G member 2 [Auxenochlorella protothecoides]KFM28918.1 ATP-binding cassette sub-family G member 2 [Auxenochlorella protothecoides]
MEVGHRDAKGVPPSGPSGHIPYVDSMPAINGKESDSDQAKAGAGMLVTFDNVTYTVVNSANKKEKISLLQGVSGYFQPGQLNALMGPSGSGKTTLLDVLAGRKTTGKQEGAVLYGGVQPSGPFLRRYTGYVEQFDTLLGNLTVRENLQYTAELKARVSLPLADKVARVERSLRQLGLETCQNVLVGTPAKRGVSGGQLKRTNIGLALVTSPLVLFLDEPTTGLDSYTSQEVMDTVAELARTGITVCATIHSPTPHVFRLFDRLFVILQGRTAYFGPNNSDVVPFFQRAAQGLDGLSERSSLSDVEYMTDIVVQSDRQGRSDAITDYYAASDLAAQNREDLGRLAGVLNDLTPSQREYLAVKRATVTPSWFGLKTLFKYRLRADLKDPLFLLPRVVDKLLIGFILFTLYWHVGKDLSEQNITNIVAVLFMWTVVVAYSASAYIPAILMERPLFIRERSDGLFRVVTYLGFKLLEEFSVQFILCLPISAMVFYPLELSGSWALFWLVYYFTTLVGISLGYFIAALSPNMDVANAALPLFITIFLFFTGLLIRWVDTPWYWRWVGYVNFLRYSWGALMINQFQGANAIYLGSEVLEYFALSGYAAWQFFGYLTIFVVVFSFWAWLALAFIKHVVR